jgi:hypothetical protein
MFVDMPLVHVMQVAFVQVVCVTLVLNRRVTAAFAVLVFVVVVDGMVRHRHSSRSAKRVLHQEE